MSKTEFLAQLRESLSGLPREDVEERLSFYSEMLDDRMEEGFSEEDAVEAAGPVKKIAEQVTAEIPLSRLAKVRLRSRRRLRGWEIALIALGSPLWLSLGIAAAAAAFSLYAALWAVIAALWAVFASLLAVVAAGVPLCVLFSRQGNIAAGIAMLAAGSFSAGLAIFCFFGCRAATRAAVWIARKLTVGIKRCFIRREDAE